MNESKKPAAKKTQEDLMYLGPTITGVVRHSTIFKNGVFPQNLKECVEGFPAMKKLFVNAEGIPGAVKELRKKQSTLKTIYSQVSKKFS